MIDSEKAYMYGLLKKFVGIPTVVPPGMNYKKMVDCIAAEGRKIGLRATKIKAPLKYTGKLASEMKGERWSVLLNWDTGAKKKLHFNGHLDVVPPTSGFTTDPFKLTKRGKKLIGRGAGDMKCGIVASLAAVKALKKLGIKPAWNIEFSFCCDEEIGGVCGTNYLIKEGFIKADAGIEVDGSGGEKITIAHRGIFELIVTVFGKPAHAGRHTEGVNAFLKGIEIVKEIEKYRLKIEKRVTKLQADNRISRIATLMVGGKVFGGVKSNAVPDRFTFTIDRRILPEEKLPKVRSEILKVIKNAAKAQGVKVEISEEMLPSSGVKENDYITKVVKSAVTVITGKAPRLVMTGGRLDMEYFNTAGIPMLSYGVSGKIYHGDDEYVELEEIVSTAKVYAEIIKTI